jgi:hypothetical protein
MIAQNVPETPIGVSRISRPALFLVFFSRLRSAIAVTDRSLRRTPS